MNLQTVWRVSASEEVTYRHTHVIDVDTRKVLCERNAPDASWYTVEGGEQEPPTCPVCLTRDPRFRREPVVELLTADTRCFNEYCPNRSTQGVFKTLRLLVGFVPHRGMFVAGCGPCIDALNLLLVGDV